MIIIIEIIQQQILKVRVDTIRHTLDLCPTITQKQAQTNTVVNQTDKSGPGGLI